MAVHDEEVQFLQYAISFLNRLSDKAKYRCVMYLTSKLSDYEEPKARGWNNLALGPKDLLWDAVETLGKKREKETSIEATLRDVRSEAPVADVPDGPDEFERDATARLERMVGAVYKNR